MKRLNIIIIGLAFLGLAFSCDKLDSLDDYKDVKVGNTATMPLNGEYWVYFEEYDSTNSVWLHDPYGIGYNRIMLYNTAANRADSIWIDDLGLLKNLASALPRYTVKIGCDPKNKAFLATDQSVYGLRIFDGKLIINGATTSGNNITDSIVIDIEYTDVNTGIRNRLAGYRRTGFIEDDH